MNARKPSKASRLQPVIVAKFKSLPRIFVDWLVRPSQSRTQKALVKPARQLEEFLLSGRNSDGGWPYHRGKASRLEPTCWALLALQGTAEPLALRTWPVTAGLMLDRANGSVNYAFNGLALLAMRALRLEHAGGTAAVLKALQSVRGDKLPRSNMIRQDTRLQGWSWIADTFSWVEPTAWCLLALKQWARTPGASINWDRVEVAERLLVDRCCVTGGWNYGNSNVLGQELKAFVPTTAIALLALQDRRGLPEVQRSVDFLEQHATTERSGTALSLALLALQRFERPLGVVSDALVGQVSTTMEFGSQMAAAMSLYAVMSLERGDAAFAVR